MAKASPVVARTRLEVREGKRALKRHGKAAPRSFEASPVVEPGFPRIDTTKDITDPNVRLPHQVQDVIDEANSYYSQLTPDDLARHLSAFGHVKLTPPDPKNLKSMARHAYAQAAVNIMAGLARNLVTAR